jgi:hypothetical protein
MKNPSLYTKEDFFCLAPPAGSRTDSQCTRRETLILECFTTTAGSLHAAPSNLAPIVGRLNSRLHRQILTALEVTLICRRHPSMTATILDSGDLSYSRSTPQEVCNSRFRSRNSRCSEMKPILRDPVTTAESPFALTLTLAALVERIGFLPSRWLSRGSGFRPSEDGDWIIALRPLLSWLRSAG